VRALAAEHPGRGPDARAVDEHPQRVTDILGKEERERLLTSLEVLAGVRAGRASGS
jgi:hypothetical protein